MEEYFHLFACTFWAVKQVDPRFRVGGPAICGVRDELWIRCFLEFCRKERIPLDFLTRHHYTTAAPEVSGHYGYAELPEPEAGWKTLQCTRDIADRFEEFRGIEIHITEFNTSYIPNCPLHDTNRNAAYIAHQLSRLGDMNASYSYWTFGDIFEEKGVPFTPFHGGFGLVANGCIPKPTFWVFSFFKALQGECVHRSADAVIVRTESGTYRLVAWNQTLDGTGEALSLIFTLPAEEGRTYSIITKTVDEETCNPLKLWHDLGEPSSLLPEQKKLLRQSAVPLISSDQKQSSDGSLSVTITLKENAVVYCEAAPITIQCDRGYDYHRAIGK